MACTLMSVGSLIVLILASYSANMETTTVFFSTTVQNKEPKTVTTLSTIHAGMTEPDSGVTDEHFVEKNKKVQNASLYNNNSDSFDKTNCSATRNKTAEENCPTNTTTLLNKMTLTYRDFKEYEYYKNVYDIIPYASNIPGLITNLLTVVVAANIKPLQTSEICMVALGISDFITVLTRGAHKLWMVYDDVDNSAGCKIPYYVIHVASVYSNLILLFWTVERFIAVFFPMKLVVWCSVRNTKITLMLILLLCLLLGIPYLTDNEAMRYWTGRVTIVVCFQTDFFNTVWTHTQSVYYIYIPVICVCICNIGILCKLSSITKARIQMANNQKTIDKKASENRKMTILLLTISGCFLLLHIPYAAILVFYYIYPDPTIFISKDPHFFAKFIFYSTLGYLITEFQNVVNFFLYCISGSKFRATFKKMFCKSFIKRKEEQDSRSNATRSTKI